jgi:predicted nucleic acid-binding protein
VTILVDTSALYALADRDDPNHPRAKTFWSSLPVGEVPITHNYVMLETCALVQRRLGIDALQSIVDEIAQPISTLFVDEDLHRTAVATVLGARRRDVSLVDRVSFEVMRRLGVDSAFAFDSHFTQFGFRSLPTETL